MRAAIYTRISKDQQKDGDNPAQAERQGVQRQLEACMKLVSDQPGWEVVTTFEDNDISAFSGKVRPGFEALLDAMKRKEIDAVVCWHTDRLYRNLKDLVRLVDVAQGVQIRTVNGGDLDLSTATGKMMAGILGSVAAQESEHKGERQKAANLKRAAQGVWLTANRPFGYTQAGEPLESEAAHYRRAVADVLAGKSIQGVAKQWNAAGVKTTLAGREQKNPHSDKRGVVSGQWNSPRVRRLLMNPRYAGIRTYRGREAGKGTWTPLISADDHHALVSRLSDPSRLKCASFERKYIGSGVYICGKCGGKMKAALPGGTKANGNPNRKSRAYVCRAHSHVLRAGEPVDAYVTEVVLRRLESETLVVDQEIDLPGLQRERDGVQGRLDQLTDAFTDAAIDATQFRRGSASLRSQLAVIDGHINAATSKNPLADLMSQRGRIRERWQELTPTQQADVIDRIAEVRILPCPKGLRRFDSDYVQITWRGEDTPQGG